MFVSDCLGVNEKGRLTIGDCDTIELAKQFGTPLYVMDEAMIRNNCRLYKKSFEKYYNGKGLPLYASKALSCMELCRIVKEEGLGIDVVSLGELYTALKAGVLPEQIHFHGNNKTREELEFALSSGVGRIVIDHFEELKILDQMAKNKGVNCKIALRIKPGVDAHTHEFIKTGQIDSKFGFSLETGEAMLAVEAAKCSNLVLKELHCHIGSQIFDIEPFVHTARVMMEFIKEIKQRLQITIEELNLGGGFGIQYTDCDHPVPYDRYMECVAKEVKKRAEEYGLAMPFVYIEPGRSIVGEAGITLYRVGAIKEIPGIRTYVSVDGGMCDNPRYALYQANYTAVIANKAAKKATKKVTIAGKCCESGDLIQENTMIQDPAIGDVMAVLSTGAYNYSMASNYNRIQKPAIVMIRDQKPRVVVERQSLDDLLRNDR